MAPDQIIGAPVPSLRRLPSYLRVLRQLQAAGRDTVSCTHIAEDLHLDPTQVRKDLALTGIVGRPRVGYDLQALIDAIESFLGWNNTTDAVLVGTGNLGAALMGYEGFKEYGLNIVAAFDSSPAKVGVEIQGKKVFHLDDLHGLVRRMHIHIGIITTPAEAAQSVANYLVLSGIKAIWNFAPAKIEVPAGVIIENVELSASLAVLSSKLTESLRGSDK